MLKTDKFLASFFEGFEPRFGRVFARFFGPQMHAKSERLIFVKSQQNISFIGTEETSAPLQQSIFRVEIHAKSHVFWDIDFEGILGGFWEGFGRPKSSIFALFSMFFRSHFWSTLGKSKKSAQEAQKQQNSASWRSGCGDPQAPGERQREGNKNLTENLSVPLELGPLC